MVGGWITPAEAFAAIRERRPEWVLLDVREKGQASLGQPFGAVNLPYSRLELLARDLLPRRDAAIAILDGGDGVAVRAAGRLSALGHADLAVVEGGLPAWQAAGLPLFEGVHVVSKAFGEWVEQTFAVPSITPEALEAAQRAGSAPFLIDGRPEAEYRRFSLPVSRSCPNGEMAARLATLAPLGSAKGGVAVHCAGRTRSLIGAQTLCDLDPTLQVVAVRDGTQGWQLAGFKREDAPSRPAVPAADVAAAREVAEELIARFALPVIDGDTAARLAADEDRTTYLIDPRSEDEAAEAPAPKAFRVAPATTLIQQTDRFVAVQGARMILWDPLLARAAVAAHWLRRMGIEALILDGTPPTRHVIRRDPLARLAEVGAAHFRAHLSAGWGVLDLRPSAEHAAARPVGSRWSIRPRVTADAGRGPLILIGDAVITASAAVDLVAAGHTVFGRLAGGPDDWAAAGIAIERDTGAPPPAERLDVEQFCAGRHQGDLAAARAYLDWEHGLLDRIAAAGIDPGWRA